MTHSDQKSPNATKNGQKRETRWMNKVDENSKFGPRSDGVILSLDKPQQIQHGETSPGQGTLASRHIPPPPARVRTRRKQMESASLHCIDAGWGGKAVAKSLPSSASSGSCKRLLLTSWRRSCSKYLESQKPSPRTLKNPNETRALTKTEFCGCKVEKTESRQTESKTNGGSRSSRRIVKVAPKLGSKRNAKTRTHMHTANITLGHLKTHHAPLMLAAAEISREQRLELEVNGRRNRVIGRPHQRRTGREV